MLIKSYVNTIYNVNSSFKINHNLLNYYGAEMTNLNTSDVTRLGK